MEHFYNTLQGGFDYPELYSRMVSEAPGKAVFVEIGVFQGRSAAYMAVEIINSGKDITLHAVDPDMSFIGNLRDVSHIVVPHVALSVDASAEFDDDSIDFVWVDGDHTEDGVRADIAAWLPKLKHGGYMGGHDYSHPQHPGVAIAVDDLLPDREIVSPQPDLRMVDSWLWRKPIK